MLDTCGTRLRRAVSEIQTRCTESRDSSRDSARPLLRDARPSTDATCTTAVFDIGFMIGTQPGSAEPVCTCSFLDSTSGTTTVCTVRKIYSTIDRSAKLYISITRHNHGLNVVLLANRIVSFTDVPIREHGRRMFVSLLRGSDTCTLFFGFAGAAYLQYDLDWRHAPLVLTKDNFVCTGSMQLRFHYVSSGLATNQALCNTKDPRILSATEKLLSEFDHVSAYKAEAQYVIVVFMPTGCYFPDTVRTRYPGLEWLCVPN